MWLPHEDHQWSISLRVVLGVSLLMHGISCRPVDPLSIGLAVGGGSACLAAVCCVTAMCNGGANRMDAQLANEARANERHMEILRSEESHSVSPYPRFPGQTPRRHSNPSLNASPSFYSRGASQAVSLAPSRGSSRGATPRAREDSFTPGQSPSVASRDQTPVAVRSQAQGTPAQGRTLGTPFRRTPQGMFRSSSEASALDKGRFRIALQQTLRPLTPRMRRDDSLSRARPGSQAQSSTSQRVIVDQPGVRPRAVAQSPLHTFAMVAPPSQAMIRPRL